MRRITNYFASFLFLDLLIYKFKSSYEKGEALPYDQKTDFVKLLGIPFVVGSLVGIITAIVFSSWIPLIIVSIVPALGSCLLLAALIVGDIDYSIPLASFNFIASLVWVLGALVGITSISIIF